MVHRVVAFAAFLCSVNGMAQPLPGEQEVARRIKRMEEVTEGNPRDVGSWHDLADLYRAASEWDRAIEADTKAVEKFPKYAIAYYGRAQANMAKKNFAAARADFSKAIDLMQARGGLEIFLTLERPPESLIDSYRTRGVAWSHEGRFAEGIADISIAMKLRKDDARLHYERGYLEEKVGKSREAVVDYYRAGQLYLDGSARVGGGLEECIGALERMGGAAEVKALRGRMAEKQRSKSDLP